ncbi:MAG: 4Fe-4S dicluster domain-containing protein [Streptosporangiales bacterium]|nr:4Fe-4S dicluster domain-containing protein [Streptosporangiales bacterium]
MPEITPGKAYGFFTDTSVCIGCKACEVACKTWNLLEGHEPSFLDGFDNTGGLDAENWRHVQFHDNVPDQTLGSGQGSVWLMMSDVCKHCQQASCMEVCPTGAIIRTEFDSVFIQPDVCNGCRDCIAACPYDVIGANETTGVVQKCTLCYDRLQGDMMPACAQACPTESIQFGEVDVLRESAQKRVDALHAAGVSKARLYGADDSIYGGLNAFFLLMDEPSAYRLPNERNAVLPSRNNIPGYLGALVTGVLGVLGGLIAIRRRGQSPEPAEATAGGAPDGTAGAADTPDAEAREKADG